MRYFGFLAASSVLVLACSSSSPAPGVTPDASAPDALAPTPDAGDAATGNDAGSDASTNDGGPIGGDRPVTVQVPPSYVPGTPMPLVIMLHGYGFTGDVEEGYLGLGFQANKRGFLYAHPDGTVDAQGHPFWNATDACCDSGHTNVDDSAYLSAVIKDIQSRYSVDPKRIYLMGHSNGGFMSYRMACDHADQIAAIVSLAGAMYIDVSKCKPQATVSVLEIHGTADQTILYAGGPNNGSTYPSADTSVTDWATLDGCASTKDTTSPPIDLDASLPGNETTVTKYDSGCRPGGHAELWSIAGGAHIPTLSGTFTSQVVDFLFAHPKP